MMEGRHRAASLHLFIVGHRRACTVDPRGHARRVVDDGHFRGGCRDESSSRSTRARSRHRVAAAPTVEPWLQRIRSSGAQLLVSNPARWPASEEQPSAVSGGSASSSAVRRACCGGTLSAPVCVSCVRSWHIFGRVSDRVRSSLGLSASFWAQSWRMRRGEHDARMSG